MWTQKLVLISPKSRGFHLITPEVLSQLEGLQCIETGILHLFLQHTSASITLNENADPSVRRDLERYFLQSVPDSDRYEHDDEGPDDMPAHIKSVLVGTQLSVPISQGQLLLGCWQGIYLGEHRINAGARRIVATISGQGE